MAQAHVDLVAKAKMMTEAGHEAAKEEEVVVRQLHDCFTQFMNAIQIYSASDEKGLKTEAGTLVETLHLQWQLKQALKNCQNPLKRVINLCGKLVPELQPTKSTAKSSAKVKSSVKAPASKPGSGKKTTSTEKKKDGETGEGEFDLFGDLSDLSDYSEEEKEEEESKGVSDKIEKELMSPTPKPVKPDFIPLEPVKDPRPDDKAKAKKTAEKKILLTKPARVAPRLTTDQVKAKENTEKILDRIRKEYASKYAIKPATKRKSTEEEEENSTGKKAKKN